VAKQQQSTGLSEFDWVFFVTKRVAGVPRRFPLDLTHASTPIAASGGFAGAAVWAAIQFGVPD
jgi:hypothetical protein